MQIVHWEMADCLCTRVSTNYLHMANSGREFDKRRDKEILKRLYNIYS